MAYRPGMTFAPADLLALRAYLQRETGLPAVSLGIVGDTAHANRGTSYHLGRDALQPDAYSIRTARDRAGLTNAASAIDIGRFSRLRPLSLYLVGAAQRNAPGTRDIREIIYTPDGHTVLRYDRERGIASLPRPGEADDSHLTHTHVSYYRDSRDREKVALYRGFFNPATEDVMLDKLLSTGGVLRTLPVGTDVYDKPQPLGGVKVGDTQSANVVYHLIARVAEAPGWYLIDGGGDDGKMRWVKIG